MLSHLKIKNIALIDTLEIEFGDGLNLLTGETGSGKSIIVDSLSALTGERVSSDLIKQGAASAQIEGLFSVRADVDLVDELESSGIDFDMADVIDIIVRRDLSLSGKNRIFINDQMVTQTLLRRIGSRLVDIHGQGEQAALYNVSSHIAMLDVYAGNSKERNSVADAYRDLAEIRRELDSIEKDDSEKLQLVDILKFQINELKTANIQTGEDTELDDEKRRLNNVEKLSALSDDAYALLYDNAEATLATLERAARKIADLGEFEPAFREFDDGIRTAQALLEEAAFAARDYRRRVEFSPERLEQIESRLAEISRLKRKYGDSVEALLAHLAASEARLADIETSDLTAVELRKQLKERRSEYVAAAQKLHESRVGAAQNFEKSVAQNLADVALEKAKLETRIESPAAAELNDPDHIRSFTANGFDRVEFYFSANAGEAPKSLAKVASGGEASRLMLILKTTSKAGSGEKAAVFDEIDVGIGGRVAEAVGRKLKELSGRQQVMCVTHQPQIASLADRHFVVEKAMSGDKTSVSIRELNAPERIEEIARMLAGEHITDAARENARAMLAGAR
ncbi:MAG: DNA repair protein RecN [Acidobacteriota bacterium]